jgi:hypothetical protein
LRRSGNEGRKTAARVVARDDGQRSVNEGRETGLDLAARAVRGAGLTRLVLVKGDLRTERIVREVAEFGGEPRIVRRVLDRVKRLESRHRRLQRRGHDRAAEDRRSQESPELHQVR